MPSHNHTLITHVLHGTQTLTQKLKKKLQVMQNKCICFFLQLDKVSTISHKEFKDSNWLPVINRFRQCVISIVFKFIKGNCPFYLNEVFELVFEGNINLRNNFLKLKRTFRNENSGQKSLSFIVPSFWNQMPETLKKSDNLNTFKHNLKRHFFQSNDLIFIDININIVIYFYF